LHKRREMRTKEAEPSEEGERHKRRRLFRGERKGKCQNGFLGLATKVKMTGGPSTPGSPHASAAGKPGSRGGNCLLKREIENDSDRGRGDQEQQNRRDSTRRRNEKKASKNLRSKKGVEAPPEMSGAAGGSVEKYRGGTAGTKRQPNEE